MPVVEPWSMELRKFSYCICMYGNLRFTVYSKRSVTVIY